MKPGECLLISSLPGKAWKTLVGGVIQHVFSKLSLVILISRDANLVDLFHLLVYKLIHSSNLRLCRNYKVACRFNVIDDVIQKVKRHDDLIKAHAWR